MSAQLPVLVSTVLPNGVDGFSRINGVWVVSFNSWPGLATVLREQIIQVAYARVASEGKDTKMSDLYDYLVGDEFVRRVTAIAEAFKGIQSQVQKERRAMESHWSERPARHGWRFQHTWIRSRDCWRRPTEHSGLGDRGQTASGKSGGRLTFFLSFPFFRPLPRHSGEFAPAPNPDSATRAGRTRTAANLLPANRAKIALWTRWECPGA